MKMKLKVALTKKPYKSITKGVADGELEFNEKFDSETIETYLINAISSKYNDEINAIGDEEVLYLIYDLKLEDQKMLYGGIQMMGSSVKTMRTGCRAIVHYMTNQVIQTLERKGIIITPSVPDIDVEPTYGIADHND